MDIIVETDPTSVVVASHTTITIEYHIVYNVFYHSPVLLFNPYTSEDHKLLPLESVWNAQNHFETITGTQMIDYYSIYQYFLSFFFLSFFFLLLLLLFFNYCYYI